jgi:hypothetical protein
MKTRETDYVPGPSNVLRRAPARYVRQRRIGVYRAPPTTHDLGDGAVKQALRATARRKVLALDGTKFGQGALAVVCELAADDSREHTQIQESTVAGGVPIKTKRS